STIITIVRNLLAYLALMALMGACASHPETHQRTMKLQIDMTQEQVLAVMGRPKATETFNSVEFWLYAPNGDDDQEAPFLPVGFVEHRVSGWGRAYHEAVTSGRTRPDGSIADKR